MSSILRVHGSNSLITLSDTALGLSTFSSLADVCRTLGGACRTQRRRLSNPWRSLSTTTAEGASTWLIMSSYRQKEKHVTCPYNPTHSILPERLYKHLRKCALQNPDLVSKMRVCPFLSTHIITEEEFEDHVRHCPRRDTIRRWFPNLNITECFPNLQE